MSYMTLDSQKTTISEKNSLMTPFLLCSYFRAHPTLLLKILGDGCMGRPHLKFFLGDRFPSSPRSPPLTKSLYRGCSPCIITDFRKARSLIYNFIAKFRGVLAEM